MDGERKRRPFGFSVRRDAFDRVPDAPQSVCWTERTTGNPDISVRPTPLFCE